MATYYDYGTSTTSGSSNWTHYASSGTTNSSYWTSNTTYLRPRRYLVHLPDHWDYEKDGLAWVELINVKTRTGFIVELLIEGKVTITDPLIDRRTLVEFLPLVKLRATRNDWALVEMFLKEHPLTIDPD